MSTEALIQQIEGSNEIILDAIIEMLQESHPILLRMQKRVRELNKDFIDIIPEQFDIDASFDHLIQSFIRREKKNEIIIPSPKKRKKKDKNINVLQNNS